MSLNLNSTFYLHIQRYVETFEEEEQINLEIVSEKLVNLENEINATKSSIESFCKELNISTPF